MFLEKGWKYILQFLNDLWCLHALRSERALCPVHCRRSVQQELGGMQSAEGAPLVLTTDHHIHHWRSVHIFGHVSRSIARESVTYLAGYATAAIGCYCCHCCNHVVYIWDQVPSSQSAPYGNPRNKHGKKASPLPLTKGIQNQATLKTVVNSFRHSQPDARLLHWLLCIFAYRLWPWTIFNQTSTLKHLLCTYTVHSRIYITFNHVVIKLNPRALNLVLHIHRPVYKSTSRIIVPWCRAATLVLYKVSTQPCTFLVNQTSLSTSPRISSIN